LPRVLRLPPAVLLIAALATGVTAGPYRAPRTASGAPDLQGVWTYETMTRLERPKDLASLVLSPAEAAAYEKKRTDRYTKEVAPLAPGEAAPQAVERVGQDAAQWYRAPDGLARIGGQIRSSLIVEPADGQLPVSEATRAAAKVEDAAEDGLFDNPESRPIDERCLLGAGGSPGPPILVQGVNTLIEIVQSPQDVALQFEWNHDVRIIPLDRGRSAVRDRWMGESVGRWEGDTLVVETTHFSPAERWHGTGDSDVPIGPDTVVVERFTRTGPAEILYRFEVTDPTIYTRPWRGEMPLRLTQDRIFECACHEGNYALPGILAGARKAEADAAKAGGAGR
jgi:hypothetical protein